MTAAAQDTSAISRAQLRAELYQLGAIAFGYPRQPVYSDIASGLFQRAVDERRQALGLPALELPIPQGSYGDFEAGYIAAYHGPAGLEGVCSLCETDHIAGDGSRGERMVQLTTFYRHFGLRISGGDGLSEQPDHLSCELEMIAYLGYREAERTANQRDGAAYRRAQRDFLKHHLGRWLPILAARIAESRAPAFHRALIYSLTDVAARHAQDTEAAGAGVTNEIGPIHGPTPDRCGIDGHARQMQ